MPLLPLLLLSKGNAGEVNKGRENMVYGFEENFISPFRPMNGLK